MLSMVEFNNIIMPNEYPNRDSTLKDRLRPQENTEFENYKLVSLNQIHLIYILHLQSIMGMDASPLSEPVVCSKCNLLFDTDSNYIEHYDQKRKRDN
jgi:hypothetical protein